MKNLIGKLSDIHKNPDSIIFINNEEKISFNDILETPVTDLSMIAHGDVVALIGDFDKQSIATFLKLIDMGAIVIPLTEATRSEHEYFFETAFVDVIINTDGVRRRFPNGCHELIEELRRNRHAGLVLFSSGTTGHPKAILHDMTLFLKRFETPRHALRTLNFLLFDHIGGINTLFHTLFNKGIVIAPSKRTIESILDTCDQYHVELLPTTPTFLRLMLMSGAIPDRIPGCLKIITYGTERMDQITLDALCRLLPNVDFRQTYGMSELGIVRAKSEARNSLFMKIGGEGIETKVVDNVLYIRSQNRMLGYLNAPSPFDDENWYNTKDIVEQKNGYYKITGRTSEVINIGGLKFMASDVEMRAIEIPDVAFAEIQVKNNPITGQHIELVVQINTASCLKKEDIKNHLKAVLPKYMIPSKITFSDIEINHRFKRT